MNLVLDRWIPVRRRSGSRELVAPCEITSGVEDDPVVALASPRADFDGSLIQFLIGLLQTTCAPESTSKWRVWRREPPDEDTLREKFKTIAHAFELDGDGPRFLQDFTLDGELGELSEREREKRKKPVHELLIDSPTGKTLEDNTDYFIKRGGVESLCMNCAASALLTLQLNAPSGGQGHRTSLRGGGPMNTIIEDETLWHTCWLNVLDKNRFHNLANSRKGEEGDRFPWLAPARTSGKGGVITTVEDVHPNQIYWSMPRRIRLLFDHGKSGECGICGDMSERRVGHFYTINLGINYEGSWIHPITPSYVDKDGSYSSLHPQPGGIGYRHWLGLVLGRESGKGKRVPAPVVEVFRGRRLKGARLRVFGYDMDNMKARCWYEASMPVVVTEEDVLEEYRYSVNSIVASAEMASGELRRMVRKAFFRPGLEPRGDLSFVTSRFWEGTEPDFYESLHTLSNILESGENTDPVLESWHRLIASKAEEIFDDVSQSGEFDAVDPRRISLARIELTKKVRGKKMREVLGLPEKQKAG